MVDREEVERRFREDLVEASQWFLSLPHGERQVLLADRELALQVLEAAGVEHSSLAFDVEVLRRALEDLLAAARGASELDGSRGRRLGSVAHQLATVIDVVRTASPTEIVDELGKQVGLVETTREIIAAGQPEAVAGPSLLERRGGPQLLQGLDALAAHDDIGAAGMFRAAIAAGDPLVGARAAAGIGAVALAREQVESALSAFATAASLAVEGGDATFASAMADRWEHLRVGRVGADTARCERLARWPPQDEPRTEG